MRIIEIFKQNFNSNAITTSLLVTTLLTITILSIYEYITYRYVSKKGIYNNTFNISIVVLPYFISTIILCLQSNIVVTLGTIGALAIIRYRTAVKDPVDMVYLLWSIHNGIMVGCQLYKVAIITSLVVTIVILLFSNLKLLKSKYTLVLKTRTINEELINNILKSTTKSYCIKVRNCTNMGVDYIIDLNVKDVNILCKTLDENSEIDKYSLLDLQN